MVLLLLTDNDFHYPVNTVVACLILGISQLLCPLV